MVTMKRGAAAVAAIALGLTGLAACGTDSADGQGHVYFLNSKSEIVDQLDQLASMYTEETGVEVEVQTATSGTFDSTLTSELAKSNAPTMFNIAGYDQFAKYMDYLEPLTDTDVYDLLTEDGKAYSYAVDGESYTLPYAAEWYGIIYNKAILEDYCSKSYAVIDSVDDITDYDTFKSVVESIQENKDDLGLTGAITSPGLDASDAYRFVAHMSRIPLFFEYRDNDTTFMPEIKGTYLDNYKDLFDLELESSPTEPGLLSSKTYDDCTAEFALGQVAFYPNGVWAYSGIKDNEVADEDLGMLPYYMGIEGEEEYGPAGVYDASWAVNKNSDEKDKQATLDFIEWMVTDDEAKQILAKDCDLAVPFTTFGDDDQPDNPLTAAARAYTEAGKTELRSFTIPNQQWQDNITNALVEYAQGTGDWATVKDAFVNGWATEWANNEESLGMLPQADKFSAEG